MNLVVAYLLAVGAGLIVGAVLLEWADAKERLRRSLEWDEFEALMAARDVTGRIGSPQRWES